LELGQSSHPPDRKVLWQRLCGCDQRFPPDTHTSVSHGCVARVLAEAGETSGLGEKMDCFELQVR
jgi:hypothetical protein